MITITKDYLPLGSRKRTGKKNSFEGITIHSTANPLSTAINERKWLENPSNRNVVAWHLVIDDTTCIQAMPLDEYAVHAQEGSHKTFSIEICESGNRKLTIDRAATLIAQSMVEYNFTIDSIYRHEDWYKKGCPRIFMENNWKEWYVFLDDIENKRKQMLNTTYENTYIFLKKGDTVYTKDTKEKHSIQYDLIEKIDRCEGLYCYTKSYSIKKADVDKYLIEKPAYKIDGMYGLQEGGLSFDISQWLEKIDSPMPTWATFAFLNKIIQKYEKEK